MKTPLLAAALGLAACTRPPAAAESSAALVAEARTALAERERRLTSLRLAIESTQGEERARHEVTWRSPNRAWVHLRQPRDLELGIDGARSVRVDHTQKTHETYAVRLSPARAAYFFASTFMPLVPEGYRAPLLPSQGVEGRLVTHPQASRAVALTTTTREEVPSSVTYVLRLPAGDFLEKRTVVAGQERVLSVARERCDEALRLCVPLELVDALDGRPFGRSVVTAVELNPAVPADAFLPPVPEGYTATQRALVDEEAAPDAG